MSVRLDPGGDELSELNEINVTPFIDVILVLLIIFMIAAPLATVDMPVDLPTSTARPTQRADKTVYVTLKADQIVLVGETPLDGRNLAGVLDRETGANHEQRIFLRADRSVTYGDLTNLMNDLRAAGYLKLALVALEGQPNR